MRNSFPVTFPDDEPPHRLVANRYRFLSHLGQGGMGRTDRYWDTVAGRPVVLKRPRPEFVDKPGFLERFDREVRLMQALVNPHIVPIIDVGFDEGLPFIVMPFLPGGSLSVRRLRDASGSPLPNPASMFHLWLPAIAAALDHVHVGGVVHRDVKPANIFFDALWHAYLGDFGVAKVVDEVGLIDKEQTLTGTHVAIGTECYMGPELFSPKPTLTGAVDQYALAVMVYELLCGRRPFLGDTAHLIVEVTTKQPPSLDLLQPGLPGSLVHAVHRGLAKRPAERFASCSAFAAAVLADVPVMADEPDVARLACPSCGHLIKIATSDAGKRGRCPKCRKRLVIAADLAALWTRDEEAIVMGFQTTAPWPDDGPVTPVASDEGDSGSVFKPLSRPTPLARRRRRNLIWEKLLLTVGWLAIGTVAVTIIGGLAFGDTLYDWWYGRGTTFSLDRTAPVVIDEKRIVAFPPVRWRIAPQTSDCLVTFEPRNGSAVPRVRVVAGGDPPPSAKKAAGAGNARVMAWAGRDTRIPGRSEKQIARLAAVVVEGRRYTVEVVAPADRVEDARQLSALVAGGLEVAAEETRLPQNENGLLVEYFKDRELQDKHDYSHVVTDVNVNWGDGPPVNGLPSDHFSVRWTGFIRPPVTSRYTFRGLRDNGLRLAINRQLIVDQWNSGWGDYVSEPIMLLAGQWYPITIELYDDGGGAALTLEWQSEIGSAELVPTECLRPTRPRIGRQ